MFRVLACIAVAAPVMWAAPLRYAIDFEFDRPFVGPAPSSATFVYDNDQSNPTPFSDFIIEWEGITFDLTVAANTAPQPSYQPIPLCFADAIGGHIVYGAFFGGCHKSQWDVQISPDRFRMSNITWTLVQCEFGLCGEFQHGISAPGPGGDGPVAFSDGRWRASLAPVPEPSTGLYLLTGILGAIGVRRRSSRSGSN